MLILTPIYFILAFYKFFLIRLDVYSCSSSIAFSFLYRGPVYCQCLTFLLSPYKNALLHRF
jgi:hypothetical protein